jgi:hypothetical protein
LLSSLIERLSVCSYFGYMSDIPPMINRSQFAMWRRQVFRRHPHEDLRALYLALKGQTGIYLIGCEDKIVYIGQSWKLYERPIESLGARFREANDPTLRWSLALAPCPHEEMHERECTAIRAYAPKYNTRSISQHSSQPRAIARDNGGLPPSLLTRSMMEVPSIRRICSGRWRLQRLIHPPPWRKGKQRRKTGPREKPTAPTEFAPVEMLVGEALQKARKTYGVPSDGDMIYPINLCDDGYVVTSDGECIGNVVHGQLCNALLHADG